MRFADYLRQVNDCLLTLRISTYSAEVWQSRRNLVGQRRRRSSGYSGTATSPMSSSANRPAATRHPRIAQRRKGVTTIDADDVWRLACALDVEPFVLLMDSNEALQWTLEHRPIAHGLLPQQHVVGAAVSHCHGLLPPSPTRLRKPPEHTLRAAPGLRPRKISRRAALRADLHREAAPTSADGSPSSAHIGHTSYETRRRCGIPPRGRATGT